MWDNGWCRFLLVGAMLLSLAACPAGLAAADHYDGSRFFNSLPDHTLWDELRWLWEMETVAWPTWIEDEKMPPPPAAVGPGELRVTFINQATVLIQYSGANILTDPVWSATAGPFSWLGVKRVRAPGVEFQALPRIDYVLISHDHYDHLDLPTLRRLVARDDPVILCGLGVKNEIGEPENAKVFELDWWQYYSAERHGLVFQFTPALHGSGRWPLLRNKTLWGGFVIAAPAGNVYFAGDTGFGDFFPALAAKFGDLRLAILPVGSYEKRWFMKNQHLNPDDAVRGALLLGARHSLGIHFGTFAEHPEQAIDAHVRDLAAAVGARRLAPERFWLLKFGEGRDVP